MCILNVGFIIVLPKSSGVGISYGVILDGFRGIQIGSQGGHKAFIQLFSERSAAVDSIRVIFIAPNNKSRNFRFQFIYRAFDVP